MVVEEVLQEAEEVDSLGQAVLVNLLVEVVLVEVPLVEEELPAEEEPLEEEVVVEVV